MATSIKIDPVESKTKQSILFYLKHLSEKELKILEKLASELAENYSKSYRDWKYERD